MAGLRPNPIEHFPESCDEHKTKEMVSTALTTLNKKGAKALGKLNEGGAIAKQVWKDTDLAGKASAIVGAGAGLAAVK